MNALFSPTRRFIMPRLASAIILILLSYVDLHGQELSATDMGYDYPRTLSSLVVSPSPEATAMYRYQDCPVSYATGAAEISIPLLECRSGDLGVALSLSYHTGGIKVSDETGSIALGWAMQGLGRVSRQVNVMPDESRPFVRGSTTEDVKNQLLYNTEANYDRYSYDFPGYSGVFFLTEDSLVHMSNNGVKIERMCSSANKFATDSFAIVTPEGIRYTFGQREICKREHWTANGSGSYTDISYEVPVVWNLTTIQSLLTSEKISVTYSTGNYDRHDDPPVTLKFGRKWSYDSTQDCYMSSVSTYSDGVTRFFGHALPKSIKGRSFSADFTIAGVISSGRDDRYIKKIALRNASGSEIRRADLDNDGAFSDGRRRLDGVKITSGGKTVDHRTFTYYDASNAAGRDFFGYANGSTEYLQSVLDLSTLKLNSARRHDATLVKSWSLKSMTDVTGAITEFSYISKHWTPPAGSQNNRLTSVYNGIAVSKIETRDPLTGRCRTRSFSYSEPMMSVPLQFLTTDDFISLSGSKTYFWKFPGASDYSIYTLTAELTSSCRRPGFAAENMVIYFNKVTETVTGTDIDHAVRTDYEFDNSRCIHEFGAPSATIASAPARSPSTEPKPTSEFSMILGETIPCVLVPAVPHVGIPIGSIADDEAFYQLFHTKDITTGFTERINPAPLLSKKIIYEYRDGTYKPVETIENRYSSARHAVWVSGRHVQGNVYKSSLNNEYLNSLKLYNAISVCSVYSQSDFMRLDSTITTRHYPDGNSRQIITRHSYGSFLAGASAGHVGTADSLSLNAQSALPHSTVKSFGNEYFMTCNVRSEDIATPFYSTAVQEGFAHLPVTQKWKSSSGMSEDSIEIRQEYARFGGIAPRKSRTTLMRSGEKTAVQSIKSYDSDGNITSMTEADGTNRLYIWLSGYRLLSSSTIVSGNGNLTSTYTWEPHIGCTSITSPSGRSHTFSYTGGRLSAERNTAGDTVATYGYSLYADSGRNMTEETVFGDNGGATTRVWYDGFGLPVQSVALGAGADASQDVCTYTEYDGLDRAVRQWQPVPVSGIDSICTTPELRSFASAVYGSDSRPFTATEYLASAGEKVAAVYSPGDALADYPARTEYLCNNNTVEELKVRQLSFFNHPLGEGLRYWGLYPDGTLDAVKSVDPDGHTIITFTDWRGYKILERRELSATDFLDTYYINDVWGQPLIVLQPEASSSAMNVGTITPLINYKKLYDNAFIYRYDRCGRLIYKKIPGSEPVLYRYDSYGRLAYMQDGNMRAESRAMFTVYDAASRVAVTGMCDDDAMAVNVKIPSMTAVFDNSFTFPGLCGTGYLAGEQYFQNAELLTATYYDNYEFLGLDAFSNLPYEPSSNYASAQGLMTGTLTAVLGNENDSTPPIAAVTFYDNEERPVSTFSTTHIADTYEASKTTYTLDGQPKTVSHNLTCTDDEYNDSYEYTYDIAGRTKTVSATFPGDTKKYCIANNTYNSRGLLSRLVSDTTVTDYGYDIRGAISYLYNDAVYQQISRTPGGSICNIMENYIEHIYGYDAAGRLLSETVDNGGSLGGIYSSSYTYDSNSNITSLTRTGYPTGQIWQPGSVDDLSMTYSGNRLVKVTDNTGDVLVERSFDFHDGADNATEYAYDSNGNVIRDDNRGITAISYNALNLPSRIDILGNRSAEYIYDASGRKLACLIKEADNYTVEALASPLSLPAAGSMLPEENRTVSGRHYIGAYEFSDSTLSRIDTPYGYYYNGRYIPYIKDYQGNIRNNANYYAYGLPVQDSNVSSTDPYLYGGKEFYSLKGINLYDFSARTYAPDLARFMQPDPKADGYHWLSPYTFCGADPINNVDPDGKNIAVLLVSGAIGHLALLIQNEEQVWQYYSFNGVDFEISGKFSGGKNFNEVGVDKGWSSPQDFLNSEFNSEPETGGEDDKEHANYNYTEAYEIETTPEQDKIIAETFSEIAKEDYDLKDNNCAHAVQRSLRAAGVLPSKTDFSINFYPNSLGYSISVPSSVTTYFKPSSALRYIKRENPNGKRYIKNK